MGLMTSLEQLMLLNKDSQPVFGNAPQGVVDTRTFQQYDRNNATARRQLQPIADSISEATDRALMPVNNLIGLLEDPKRQILQNLAEGLPGMVGAIKAFHGTPHTFPAEPGLPFGRFKKEAIGSGEGHAAYGHGASYSAENPDVAREYYLTLSKLGDVYPKVQRDLYTTPVGQELLSTLTSNMKGMQHDARHSEINRILKARAADDPGVRADGSYFNRWDGKEITAEQAKYKNDMSAVSKQLLEDGYDFDVKGHLLELSHEWPDAAREAADPLSKEHLLDWDKPLNEQSEGVKGILRGQDPTRKISAIDEQIKLLEAQNKAARERVATYGDDWESALFNGNTKASNTPTLEDLTAQKSSLKFNKLVSDFIDNNPHETGNGLYTYFSKLYGDKQAASEYLHSLGIPGIKYLDGGTRNNTPWIARHPMGGVNDFPNEAQALAFMKRNSEYTLEPPKQSHNFVMFEPDYTKIIARDGIPAKGLLSE